MLAKRLQRVDDLLRHVRDAQRGGFLQLEDRDAGVDQLLQRTRDVLELDRLMADVEHDADVPAQRDDALPRSECAASFASVSADLPE